MRSWGDYDDVIAPPNVESKGALSTNQISSIPVMRVAVKITPLALTHTEPPTPAPSLVTLHSSAASILVLLISDRLQKKISTFFNFKRNNATWPWHRENLIMPPKKDKKGAKKDEKNKEEEKPVEKSEKECQLEAELKKVEDEYKATREKVNELR